MKLSVTKKRKIRFMAISCVYQSIVRREDLNHIIYYNIGDDSLYQDPQILNTLKTLTTVMWKKRHQYIKKVNSHLKGKWNFARLSHLEQAIFLVSIAEIDFKINSKAVAINEAVLLVKKYSDFDNYRYVNAVLDYFN